MSRMKLLAAPHFAACHGALTSVAKQRCSAAHPQGAITPFLQAEGYHPVFHPLNRDAPSLSYVVQVSSKTVQSLSEARNLTGRRRKRYELRSGGHVPPAGAARLPAGMAGGEVPLLQAHHRGHFSRATKPKHVPPALCHPLSIPRIQHWQSKRARPTPSAKWS